MRAWAVAGIIGVGVSLAVAPATLAQRPAKAPRASVKPVGPPPSDPADLEQYRKLNQQITNLEFQLPRLLQQYGDSHPDVAVAKRQLEELKARRNALYEKLSVNPNVLNATAHYNTLVRPIDLEFSSAQIEQVAKAISQAVGIEVEVDKAVSKDTRVTMSAAAVPLVVVLDTIASQAGLRIQPTFKGVLLTTWPALRVGNDSKVFTGPYFPWSNEWRMRPTDLVADKHASGSVGGSRIPTVGAGAAPKRPGTEATTLNPGSPSIPATGGFAGVGTMNGFGGITTPLQLGQPSITSLGNNTLVVAEPETGPKGEKLVRLTVYRFEGNRLKRISQTLHKSEAGSAATPGTSGSMSPGAMGNPMTGGMAPAKATPPLRKPVKPR